jgi:hypothetical protein
MGSRLAGSGVDAVYGVRLVGRFGDCTVWGYRRFRYRSCGKQFNERSTGLLNRTSTIPSFFTRDFNAVELDAK